MRCTAIQLDYPRSFLVRWDVTLPKWKFATQESDDDWGYGSSSDPPQGVMINKYSVWAAAAVNMGIIGIDDLTDLDDTSFASQYAVVTDDTTAGEEEEGDDGSPALAAGLVCKAADYYSDGFCDAANNDAGCKYDGGDCCESTCGTPADYTGGDDTCGIAG
jgi:hypothetical protein